MIQKAEKKLITLLKKIGLKKKENIYLNIDFMKLSFYLNIQNLKNHKRAELILNIFKKYIGQKGTIVIPIFNFSCVNKSHFDKKKTLGDTGLFANLLLKKYFSHRTYHPLYSFLVFGKLKKKFISIKNMHASDINSLWKEFILKNFKLITLGYHYNRSFTICHYFEKLVGVNYRYDKIFSLKYIDGNRKKQKTFSFFARKKRICKFSAITKKCDKYFKNKKIFRYNKSRKLLSFNLDLVKASKIIIQDLKKRRFLYINYIGKDAKNSKKVLNMQNTTMLEEYYLNI